MNLSGNLTYKAVTSKRGGNMAETILLCCILAVIVFGIQMFLCLRAKRGIKFIPGYVIIATYVAALILYLVDLLNGSGGVAIWSIFAFVISIANTVALVADAATWIVYRLLQKKKRHQKTHG